MQEPLTPLSPANGCQVDSTYQVSCDPGLVSRVLVRLKRGRDKLVASSRSGSRCACSAGMGPTGWLAATRPISYVEATAPTGAGSRGDDELYGRPGRDILDGGPGDDLVKGGAGRDVIMPSPGDDTRG